MRQKSVYETRVYSHQRFFTREGYFSDDMELIAEEFEVVEIL
ncbi:Uncharacterised protein [Yersinia enterocolitica]|nr:Uncharacterised protein [Yersinia enterocolitica]